MEYLLIFEAWNLVIQKSWNPLDLANINMWGIGLWFSMQNSKGPLFLESSKNYLELWNFSGNGLFFKQYQGLEYFSHSIFSLEFDYECRIQKFHHTRILPGIIWNSGIFLDVAYLLPNLTHWVSIQPTLIILYTFGVSLDL